jgi:cobalt-precorrin-7 (C5)-methyltransferase
MLWVVGAGICRGHITERAKRIVENADIVYGSEKVFTLIGDYIKGEKRILRQFDKSAFSTIEKEAESKKVVIASTGDPMIAGLGKLFDGKIEPGISSVQIALAKLGIDLCEVVVINAHAKKFKEFELLKNRHLLILADKNFDPSVFGHRKIVILENLCMKSEKIWSGFADEVRLKSDYTVIFVRK